MILPRSSTFLSQQGHLPRMNARQIVGKCSQPKSQCGFVPRSILLLDSVWAL